MTDHPNTAQLKLFLEGTSSLCDAGPGLHAERCPECRTKLTGLLAAAVAEAPAMPPPAPPRLCVPGFEVLGEIGRGGSGVVYRARQAALGRPVALKVLLAGAHASDEERERFAREAAALAALSHPNLVAVHDAGAYEGVPYLVMELVEGETLRERLAEGALTPAEAAALVHALAGAVAAAHGRGIIHRDLKPSNVLLASPVASAPGERRCEPARPGSPALTRPGSPALTRPGSPALTRPGSPRPRSPTSASPAASTAAPPRPRGRCSARRATWPPSRCAAGRRARPRTCGASGRSCTSA